MGGHNRSLLSATYSHLETTKLAVTSTQIEISYLRKLLYTQSWAYVLYIGLKSQIPQPKILQVQERQRNQLLQRPCCYTQNPVVLEKTPRYPVSRHYWFLDLCFSVARGMAYVCTRGDAEKPTRNWSHVNYAEKYTNYNHMLLLFFYFFAIVA